MKLKDFADVAVYGSYLVGVYYEGITHPIDEFKSTDKEKLKTYAECVVTGVWTLDENTMAVSILKERRTQMDAEKIAGNFVDWLTDVEYLDPADRETDYAEMVEDIKAAYEVAPRLINLIRDISDR